MHSAAGIINVLVSGALFRKGILVLRKTDWCESSAAGQAAENRGCQVHRGKKGEFYCLWLN